MYNPTQAGKSPLITRPWCPILFDDIQTGLNKSEAISNIAKAVEANFFPGGEIVEKERGGFIGKYKLENYISPTSTDFIKWLSSADVKYHNRTWREAFSELNGSIKKDGHKNIFLDMHASYYRRSRFFSPIDWDFIRDFKPDMFITLYDDVYDVWWRIKGKKEDFAPSGQLRLRELMAWRSIEIMTVDIIAANLLGGRDGPIPHYVLALKQPLEMVRKLLAEPNTMRVYASYPISRTKDFPEKREMIDKYRMDLHERFTVFDPLSIDERILNKALDQWRQESDHPESITIDRAMRWPLPSRTFHLPLISDGIEYSDHIAGIDPEEIVEVMEATEGRGGEINEQIVWRDFRLVDQGHCLAAFRPEFEGKLSGGVNAEIAYALHSPNVHAYQYVPLEDGTGGPFDGMAHSSSEYDEYLKSLEQLASNILGEKGSPSHIGKWKK